MPSIRGDLGQISHLENIRAKRAGETASKKLLCRRKTAKNIFEAMAVSWKYPRLVERNDCSS
jgi:hypothetical protein